MCDSESQDSLDETFCMVNDDPKIKTTPAYENVMQEVIKESQEGHETPTSFINNSNNSTQYQSQISSGHFKFPNLQYFGNETLTTPNDQQEIQKVIQDFSKSKKVFTNVYLLIPFHNCSSVKLYNQETNELINEFHVRNIGFCTMGIRQNINDYVSFTDRIINDINTNASIFRCHIFKVKSPSHTDRLLDAFRKSFDINPQDIPSNLASLKSFAKSVSNQFKMIIDIKEDDGKGNYVSVPREDNQIFKMKSNVSKKVIVNVEQISGPVILKIQRCVGLFIGAGRYLSDIDMNLLEMDSLGENSQKNNTFSISADWDPASKGFELLNNTRERDQTVYMTIGINFCIDEIQAPLCLKIACKARIFPEHHRFWISLRKMTILHLMLSLDEAIDVENNQVLIGQYVTKTIQYIWPDNIITVNCQSSHEPSISESIESDNEEPIKSGGGVVSKEITNEQLMSQWASILNQWQADVSTRPKPVEGLVRISGGVPDALRGEVWQLLAGSLTKEVELQDVYRILITKETKFDNVIKRDMPRTFTANPMFTEKDGHGQETLFRVCKSYASYDEEVGYCQGSAFLAAALILHMPEEQAFVLLVTIMNKYKLRNMYSNNFEGLHISLYQLDNLISDKMNDLSQHFEEMQLESHMYANQWFMTLFTMKFHLYAVFHILDLFLTDGMVVIFKVALALLKLSRKELLMMDFEGALNYFRVTLPKLYRNEDACHELIKTAMNIKISNKKLLTLEKEWRKIQEVRAETEDPLEIVQRDLKHTKNEYNRLDQENDSLAKELIGSKVQLQKIIDKLEENLDVVNKELFMTRKDMLDAQEQNRQLQSELKQVKDKFREEMTAREEKIRKQENIISEYKKITSQLSERADKAELQLEKLQDEEDECSTEELKGDNMNCEEGIVMKKKKKIRSSDMVEFLEKIVSKCDNCRDKVLLIETEEEEEQYEDGGDVQKQKNKRNDDEDGVICITKSKYKYIKDQISETELTLANTKLSLVESHCQQQKMLHEISELRTALSEYQINNSTQFHSLTTPPPSSSSSSNFMKKLLNLSSSAPNNNTRSLMTQSQTN